VVGVSIYLRLSVYNRGSEACQLKASCRFALLFLSDLWFHPAMVQKSSPIVLKLFPSAQLQVVPAHSRTPVVILAAATFRLTRLIVVVAAMSVAQKAIANPESAFTRANPYAPMAQNPVVVHRDALICTSMPTIVVPAMWCVRAVCAWAVVYKRRASVSAPLVTMALIADQFNQNTPTGWFTERAVICQGATNNQMTHINK